MTKPNQHIEQILTILENVRIAVKDGNYQTLGQLCKEQDRQLADLLKAPISVAPTSGEDMRRLVRLANQNKLLLQAALSGLRAAGRRKDEILQAKHSLRTYDKSGQPAVFGPGMRRLERRS